MARLGRSPPEDGERLYLDEGLVFAIFGMKMRGAWSLQYIRTTIPKNRVTSGIPFFDFTVSARAARDAAAILRDQKTSSPLVLLPDFRDRHIWGPVSSGRRSSGSGFSASHIAVWGREGSTGMSSRTPCAGLMAGKLALGASRCGKTQPLR